MENSTINSSLVTSEHDHTPTRQQTYRVFTHKYSYLYWHTHLPVSTPENSALFTLSSFSSLLSLLAPLPCSVWRWQSRLPSGSSLHHWECFCFLFFWSADLILARMPHVARCSLSISKCVFVCLYLYAYRCVCAFASFWLHRCVCAHGFVNVCALPMWACTSKIAPVATNMNVRHCELPSPKTPYKARATKKNAHSILFWRRQLYNTKYSCIQRSFVSNGTERVIVPVLETLLFISCSRRLTEH